MIVTNRDFIDKVLANRFTHDDLLPIISMKNQFPARANVNALFLNGPFWGVSYVSHELQGANHFKGQVHQ